MQNITRVVLFLVLISCELFAAKKEEESSLVTLVFFALFILIAVLSYYLKKNIQRRREVEKLLDNQRKFDSILLDVIPHPVFYKNTKGEYLGCNTAFSKLLGIKKEDIKGKTAEDFFSKGWMHESKMVDALLLSEGGKQVSEKIIHLYEDKIQQFVVTKSTFENIDRTLGGIVGIMDDITDRAQQRQFLIQQNKLAEMGEMIAAIAHQWNEPLVELSAIVQDLEFSYKRNTLQEEEMSTFVKEAMEQIQYMSTTLKDFRNFLKPSTQKTIFNVKTSFDKLLQIIKRQIEYFYIDLEINYHPEFSNITVYGYENEFMQVLLNIINNAKSKIVEKFKDSEEKRGAIKIDVWSEYDSTFIDIRDNAGGINKDIMDRIFDPYFSTKAEGTGIGLYMAKMIVSKMGGKIDVVSGLNSVTFKIEVPNRSVNIDLE